MWSEEKAQLALSVLNERIAAIYCETPKRVTFSFHEIIDRRVKLVGKQFVTVWEVRGTANLRMQHIQLVMAETWPETAIHELVHIYRPTMRHPQVKRAVQDIKRFLRFSEFARA